MRSPLPSLQANGHAPQPAQVFAISGICQEPRFRLRLRAASAQDFCLIYLGAAQFGAPTPVAESGDRGGDPYFVLRRGFDGGQAMVALRVDWEGVFTLLANDDDCAEAVYGEMIEPGRPEEVQRQWSGDPETGRMFADLLLLS